jgi:protoheme IX farnesyltransferase
MLPVTHGVRFTQLHILLYTIIMFLITLLPFATRMSNWLYLAGAVVLGLRFLYWAIEILREKNPRAPIMTFKYSITYLMLLFLVMLLDHYLLPLPGYPA